VIEENVRAKAKMLQKAARGNDRKGVSSYSTGSRIKKKSSRSSLASGNLLSLLKKCKNWKKQLKGLERGQSPEAGAQISWLMA